jgi:hypothetical protein
MFFFVGEPVFGVESLPLLASGVYIATFFLLCPYSVQYGLQFLYNGQN